MGEEHRVIDAHERVAAAARSRAAEQQHKEREDARTKVVGSYGCWIVLHGGGVKP